MYLLSSMHLLKVLSTYMYMCSSAFHEKPRAASSLQGLLQQGVGRHICRDASQLLQHTLLLSSYPYNPITHTHTHTHTYAHTCPHTHTHTHTHTHAHTHTHLCTHMPTHACTHTHTHMHARTHTHTHTHNHVWFVVLD